MGRQTRFFMEREKEEELIKFAYDKGFYVIQDSFENKKVHIYKTYEEYSLFHTWDNKYFYKDEYSNLIISNWYIDCIKSYVIEFSNTRCYINKNDERIIGEGRIWFEQKYFDDDENLVTKDEQLVKDYEMLSRWIKKNAPLQEYVVESQGKKYFYKEHITEKMLEINRMNKYEFV